MLASTVGIGRSHDSARLLGATLLGLVACSARPGQEPDFQVRGAGVVIRTDAAFAHRADFPARVESTIDDALRYWGGSWESLGGSTITFDGSAHVPCNGDASAIGCYDGDIRVSTLDAGVSLRCAEQTVLVHEVGHAVIGDADHLDPRWMDFSALAQDLAGRPGYTAEGEADCTIFPSVWRHPPRH
jgi:hypothetical protein